MSARIYLNKICLQSWIDEGAKSDFHILVRLVHSTISARVSCSLVLGPTSFRCFRILVRHSRKIISGFDMLCSIVMSTG